MKVLLLFALPARFARMVRLDGLPAQFGWAFSSRGQSVLLAWYLSLRGALAYFFSFTFLAFDQRE